MKYLSLCDGIGAAHEASKELEWTCVGASEIAAFPSAVVRERHPQIRELGDMTKHENWNIEHPDLICGGTPCQSFSVAGLRGGLADPRGNLALVFLSIVDRHRPKWVVWENVPGVYSATSHNAPDPDPPGLPLDVVRDQDVVEPDAYDADEDHAFACFLAGLQELGYGVQYRTFDAQYFGVAQRRNRVFVVGYLGDWRPATAVLLEPAGMSGNPPPSRAKGQVAAGTLGGSSQSGGFRTTDLDNHGAYIPETANPLTARMHKGVNTTMDEGQTMVPVAFKMRGGGNGTGERGGAVGTQGGVGYLGQEECAFTLSTTEDQHVAVPMAIHENQRGEITLNETSGSQGSGGGKPGQGYPAAIVPDAFAFKPAHFTRDKDGAPADIAPPLSCEADKGDQDAVVCVPYNVHSANSTAMTGQGNADAAIPTEVSRSLDTAGFSPNQGGTVVQVRMAVRRLTTVECSRLQGFPDTYCHIEGKTRRKIDPDEAAYLMGHGLNCDEVEGRWYTRVAADGPIYKALGNSWAVPNMRWIFRRIQKVDDILKRLAA